MGVGADERVGERHGLPVQVAHDDDPGQVLEVDLVHDPGSGRHHPQVAEGALRPTEQLVALAVAPVLHVHVEREGIGRAVAVDLHGVVDDEVRGHQRVDTSRIAAEFGHRIAHRGEVDDGRHPGEVLEQDARGKERHLGFGGGSRAPRRERADVGLRDGVMAGMAKHVLQQDLDGHRRVVEVGHARPLQSVDGDTTVAHPEVIARSERIGGLRRLVHQGGPPRSRAAAGSDGS